MCLFPLNFPQRPTNLMLYQWSIILLISLQETDIYNIQNSTSNCAKKNIKISETHKVSEYLYFHFKLIDNYHKILAILMTLLIIIRFPFYSFLRALNFKNFPHSLRNVDYLSSRMTEILRLLPVKNFTGTGVHLNTNPSANNKYSNYSFELSLPCRYQ